MIVDLKKKLGEPDSVKKSRIPKMRQQLDELRLPVFTYREKQPMKSTQWKTI